MTRITEYLDTLPTYLALWWFIENVTDDSPHRQDLFFYLRERVRDEHARVGFCKQP